MKIALIDLNHMTVGVHTNTVPLGIGLIARYLRQSIPQNLNIKIFKNPTQFFASLKEWQPDILGLANYVWNSELNLCAAQEVKRLNPSCVVIAGGPHLYLTSDEKQVYLKQNGFIDLCVSYDGEIPMAEIVKRSLGGETAKDLKRLPVAGSYALHPETGKLIEPDSPPPRLESLDALGPVYADGFFDELLAEGFHPFVQTHRGCPFQCAYCHTSDDYYSKMLFQSAENFRKDMEYLGKRFAGQHNVTLYVANTNFGLFEQDFEIAKIIRASQDKYDWPKNINVNSGKKPDLLLKLVELLKYKFTPSIALQTLTPSVLKNIKRLNIPFDDFVSFQKTVAREIDADTATELILSLPGETKASFLETVSRVLDSGVQNIVIYTLMALRGTPIASLENGKRYGHLIRHRIVPRCFSDLGKTKIFETEEVVVGTGTMPFEDYLNLRELALTITIFASSAEMFPVRKLLMEEKGKISDWIFQIHEQVLAHPELSAFYRAFLDETRSELFESREAFVKFFTQAEHYRELCSGKFGDNLLRKYKTLSLSKHYRVLLTLAVETLRDMMGKKVSTLFPRQFLNDLEEYLKSRDVGPFFRKGKYPNLSSEMKLHYDIPKWLEKGIKISTPENFKGPVSYLLSVTPYMQERLEKFTEMNQDPELSLQMLYRDGHIKDFWPHWTPKTAV